MSIITIGNISQIPERHTGCVKYTHSSGYEEWYKDGLLHREDGPAIKNGFGESCYFFNGRKLNNVAVQQLLDLDYPIECAIKLVYYNETK